MGKYEIRKLDLGKKDLAGDCEKLAFFYSKEFEEINEGENMKETTDPDKLYGYLKIISQFGKVIYRRYRSIAGIKQGEVHLTYRSYCELASEPGDKVWVEKSNWFSFYWYNSDAGVRWPFKIAFIGIILAIISFLITLYQLLPSFHCHHCCC